MYDSYILILSGQYWYQAILKSQQRIGNEKVVLIVLVLRLFCTFGA